MKSNLLMLHFIRRGYMKKKYIIMKTNNSLPTDYYKYESIDIYLQEGDGHTFICECGDWNNEEAQKTAKNILTLLNDQLKEKK